MEKVKATLTYEPNDEVVRAYLKKIIDYLNHKKIFRWIKFYLKHRELAANREASVEQRQKSFGTLKKFQNFVVNDLFPNPISDLREIKETLNIWERSFVKEAHKRVQSELMAIRKKARYRGDRALRVMEFSDKEGVHLTQNEIDRIVHDLSNTRRAAALIVAKKCGMGHSGIRDAIVNTELCEKGIFHVRSPRKRKEAKK